jgi:hypothetical protein
MTISKTRPLSSRHFLRLRDSFEVFSWRIQSRHHRTQTPACRWLGPAGFSAKNKSSVFRQVLSRTVLGYPGVPFQFEPENTFNKRVPSITIEATDVRGISFCWGLRTQRPATPAIIVHPALVFDKKTRGLRICHNEKSLSHCSSSRRRYWS